MKNEDLSDILNDLHGGVAEYLRGQLDGGAPSKTDVADILRLLKQNNIVVTIKPIKTNHSNQLEEARKKAEEAGSPFGYRQTKKA